MKESIPADSAAPVTAAVPADSDGRHCIAVNQVEYSNTPDGTVIHIFGRDESKAENEIVVTGFRPYFYVLRRDFELYGIPAECEADTRNVYKSIRGEDLVRIYTQTPGDVATIREKYHHFEADIPFATQPFIPSSSEPCTNFSRSACMTATFFFDIARRTLSLPP